LPRSPSLQSQRLCHQGRWCRRRLPDLRFLRHRRRQLRSPLHRPPRRLLYVRQRLPLLRSRPRLRRRPWPSRRSPPRRRPLGRQLLLCYPRGRPRRLRASSCRRRVPVRFTKRRFGPHRRRVISDPRHGRRRVALCLASPSFNVRARPQQLPPAPPCVQGSVVLCTRPGNRRAGCVRLE
jgi:hypothetical protein